MIRFINPQQYATYTPPANPQAHAVYQYVEPFIEKGSRALISNVDTEVWLAQIDDILLPVTKNIAQYENSYVCSLYTHYISYCKEEMNIVGIGGLKYLFAPLLGLLGWMAKRAQMNKVVILNNFMLSTNLYVPISKMQYQELVWAAQKQFPGFLIAFRSINEDYNATALANLISLGGHKIASRRVYLLKSENIRSCAKKLLRKDENTKQAKNYCWANASLADVPDINQFYEALYLKKYSRLNPQFTQLFYRHILQNALFRVRMLRQGAKNRGVCGVFVHGGGATAPIFGYASNSTTQDALYRVLSLWGWEMIQDKEPFNINFSSGVSLFKRARGAVGRTEYTVLFYNHLSIGRRWFWKWFTGFINRVALPIMIWKRY